MPHFKARLLTCLILSILTTATRAEFRSTADDQQALWLTIYNGGRALVKDYRELTSEQAVDELALADVAQKIMPQTVAIDGLEVREQNYDFDLLSPQSLISKNIGRKVRIARRSQQTGETIEWRSGKILSTQGGVILQMDDGTLEILDDNRNYRLIFEQLPENLRASPTLSLKLAQPFSGKRPLQLTYLTGGLSWQSDYVMQLRDEKSATLDSWITLNNQSGIEYQNAQLQLLAGDLNLASSGRRETLADTRILKAMSMDNVREQALQGYHLYSVAQPTTIKNNQSKQIKLFSSQPFPLQKKLRDGGYVDDGRNEPVRSSPDQFLLFRNQQPALGRPLPKGVIRVYGKDDQGQQQFLGEQGIGHTPRGENMEINIGKAFDIRVERQTISVRQISKKQRIYQRRIRILNGSQKTQTLELAETMPNRQWKILQTEFEHRSSTANRAVYTVELPAQQETVIDYSVRVTFP